MRLTYYTIAIGVSNVEVTSKIAEALLPVHKTEGVIISGQVSVIDMNKDAADHIKSNNMSLDDLLKLSGRSVQ